MLRFIIMRFLQGVLVMAVVYTASFWMLMAAPGDPFVGDRKNIPEVTRLALEERYGLKNPPIAYFGAYTIVAPPDKAPTIDYQDWTVGQVIVPRCRSPLALGSFALIIALWVGILIGTLGAMYKGRPLDVALTVLTLFGVSLPAFVIGTFAILLFTVIIPIFPRAAGARCAK